jgi:hypothetical protein
MSILVVAQGVLIGHGMLSCVRMQQAYVTYYLFLKSHPTSYVRENQSNIFSTGYEPGVYTLREQI